MLARWKTQGRGVLAGYGIPGCGKRGVWWKTRGTIFFSPKYEFSSLKWEARILLAYIAMNINSVSRPETRLDQKSRLNILWERKPYSLPDHSPIVTWININTNISETTSTHENNSLSRLPMQFLWENDSATKFKDILRSPECSYETTMRMTFLMKKRRPRLEK